MDLCNASHETESKLQRRKISRRGLQTKLIYMAEELSGNPRERLQWGLGCKQSLKENASNNYCLLVFFLAALPSFVSIEDGNPIIQMLLLGLIFSIIGIASDSVYAIAAGKAREWLATSEQRLATFRGLGGLALTFLGVYMLYEAIAH